MKSAAWHRALFGSSEDMVRCTERVVDTWVDGETRARLANRVYDRIYLVGLVPGLTLYENFFRNAQTAIDSGDPLNYIATTFATRPIIVE